MTDRNQRPELGPPHGFGDDQRSRALRRRPPYRAIAWVEAVLGGRVVGVEARRGGSSSAIHALRVATGTAATTVILRSYIISAVVEEEPDIVEREAHVLGLLGRTDLPTPELLAADATGEAAGVPSLLMTRLGGRLDWTPIDIDAWMLALAAVLPTLHAMPVGDDDEVQDFAPYAPPSWQPPAWLRRPPLWDRAIAVWHDPPLDHERVMIHRDYHPGNVLWRRRRVSGVVDWQAASRGPRAVDVFGCRVDLIKRFGLDVGDRFVQIWQDVSGQHYHPWAEVVMLVDSIGWYQGGEPRAQRDLESALDRRLSELGR